MGMRARHGWWAWIAAAAALLACLPLAAQTVRGVEVGSAAGHTRAVLELSVPTSYKLFRLAGPDRIVIDLDDAALADGVTLPAGDGIVRRVRTGRHGDHGLRVVLDLAEAVQPRSFLLPREDAAGHQLVVDLYADLAAEAKAPADAPAPAAAPPRDVVVAVDAGHGGADPGARGVNGTWEKDITLAVARRLAERINQQRGMRAVLTRDGDERIALKRRYEIAREQGADLFISIHADAFRDTKARGSSVWVLSPRGRTSEAARWLADRENRADLIGGVSLDDKDDTLAAVLLDLSQGASMQISSVVAQNVLQALARLGPTHRGHVEHADFVVLRSPDVPSILVETAFITNPQEEKLLRSATHRAKLADAILAGVRNYFEDSPPVGTWFAQQARERGERHVVSRGETLSGIAHRYGVSIGNLLSANKLADGNQLRAGAVIMIPTG